jgi:hypothetical protein
MSPRLNQSYNGWCEKTEGQVIAAMVMLVVDYEDDFVHERRHLECIFLVSLRDLFLCHVCDVMLDRPAVVTS